MKYSKPFSYLVGVLLLGLSACNTLHHTTFKKVYRGQHKDGSNYTIWKVPERSYESKEAKVEVWVYNTQGMKLARKQSFYVIQGQDTIPQNQGSSGRFYFKLNPGKYRFTAVIDDVAPGTITTRGIKVKEGEFIRVVMLFLEDWKRPGLHDKAWAEEERRIKQEIIDKARKEKNGKG